MLTRGIKWTDSLCRYCRTYKVRAKRGGRRKTIFPHGFSAAEPLVPPSRDGSTPLTDSLPRSIILDPTTYKSKTRSRERPPSKDPSTSLSEFERKIMENPFGAITF